MRGTNDRYAFEELWRRYRTCRRNKRNTRNALAFEIGAEAKLLELQQELRDHTYRPGRSICFVTDGPKPREVFAADFRDRVVHHLLVHHLERVFEPRFIHDSFACRVGKGTLAASDRLTEFLRRVTTNGQRSAWALTLDVASFFPSIHKQTLYRVGRFIEFYGPQRLLAERVLELWRIYLPRAGYGFAAGFPVWLASSFAQRALHQGCAVVVPSYGRLGRVAIIWRRPAEETVGQEYK